MTSPHDAQEFPSATPMQQRSEGNQNQLLGQVSHSNVFGTVEQVIINSSPDRLSWVEEVKAKPLIRRSPYLGLRKFELRDKDLFFGREQLVEELRERLMEAPFLLVLGASGSGKSSLIRAGLIPKLIEQEGTRFQDLSFNPDRDPLDSFRACLRSKGFRQADLEPLQSRESGTILQIVQALKPDDEHWLIFIDQFEEIFTLCQDLSLRQTFIDGLVELVQAQLPGVQLVAAMRADFLDRLGSYPVLADILQLSKLITDMGNEELQLAIEQPAAQHGVVLEVELVSAIINDLRGQPGEVERVSLPLLQYTLKLLWESSDLGDRTLRLNTYRSLGGVRGALQRHVDDIFSPLSEAQKQTTKHIFLQLVDTIHADPGTTAVGKAISHRVPLSEFNAEERQVLDRFVDAGLLISDASQGEELLGSDRTATVELTHETLIDAWDTLKSWIEESRPLIRLKNQLKDDAHRWREVNRQNPTQAEAELWQGSKLQRLQSQCEELESRFGTFKPEEAAFIAACEELGDRQARAELQRQRQQKRMYRGIAIGAIAALAVVSGTAAFALAQWRVAAHRELQALLASSEANFQGHPGSLDALVDSIRAGELLQRSIWLRNHPDLHQQVMRTLGQAIYHARESNRLEGHSRDVRDLSFIATEQNLIASVSYDQTLRIWNITDQSEQIIPLPNQRLSSISISPDGDHLAVVSYEGSIHLLNREGNVVIPAIEGHDGPIWDVAFSPDGQTLATAGDDGTLRFWTVTGEPRAENPVISSNVPFLCVAFSQDERWIAAGKNDGTTLLLDSQGNEVQTLIGHTDAMDGIAFSPDSQTLATASFDRRVFLWDLNRQEIQTTLVGHLDRIRDVTFSQDGQTLATAAEDGTIRLWERGSGFLIETLQAHSAVLDVEFNSDDSLLASAGQDGIIRLWRANPWLKILTEPNNIVRSIAFNATGDRIAGGDADGLIHIWDEAGEWLTMFPVGYPEIFNVQFSPDGQLIAAGDQRGYVTIFDSQGNRLRAHTIHSDTVSSLNFSPNGQTLITSGFEPRLQAWDQATDQVSTLITYETAIRDVSWSFGGNMIGVATEDGMVRLLNPDYSEFRAPFSAHSGVIYSIALSQTEPVLIATSGADQTVKLWSLDGNLLASTSGYDAGAWDLNFSPDGQWLAIASNDNTIHLWTQSGQPVTILTGHQDFVHSVHFSPDSQWLASSSADATVRLWDVSDLSLEGWLTRGCNWVQDYFASNSNPPDICVH
jgi:WD40 repeat protein